jgi:uncharacterized membrane protein
MINMFLSVRKLKYLSILPLFLFFFASLVSPINAEDGLLEGDSLDRIEAKIISIELQGCSIDPAQSCYVYTLQPDDPDPKDEIIVEVAESEYESALYDSYSVGDHVFLNGYTISGESSYAITGPVRDKALLVLFLLFAFVSLLIGKLRGLGSLLGLLVSVFVLFAVTVPLIMNGTNAVVAGFLGAFIILFAAIYFSHGFNAKSTLALFSTAIGLSIVTVLAILFVYLARLNGVGDENVIFLVQEIGYSIDLKGVLFASIIIAGVGILDDITVSQVSLLIQLYVTDPKQSRNTLFRKSMEVGKDHVASMVNTLFIAYASSSMPLVMLWQVRGATFADIINVGVISEDIVRTLVSSIGLVMIVPISSWITATVLTTESWRNILFPKNSLDKYREEENLGGHLH